jgi:hypothetical protein
MRPLGEDQGANRDSLARQCEVDPNDVYDLARRKQLSKLFVRTDNREFAPTPALVEARTITPADLQRRLDENRMRQVEASREGRLELAPQAGRQQEPGADL